MYVDTGTNYSFYRLVNKVNWLIEWCYSQMTLAGITPFYQPHHLYFIWRKTDMLKILVVEDEKPISNLICKTLREEGYHCDAAYDGK